MIIYKIYIRYRDVNLRNFFHHENRNDGKEKNKTDQPFYIYWASYALQITGSKEHQNDEGVDKRNAQASMMVLHNKHVDNVLNTLKEEGIEAEIVPWLDEKSN